jgi:flagellar motor switch protein FliG
MARIETKISDKQKAALIIISLGAEKAARIYHYLKEEEVEQITVEVASIHRVDSEKVESTMLEFFDLCLARNYISEGGIDYARDVLDRAYGGKRAMQLISKVTDTLHEHSFEFLKKADHKHLLSFIQYEHPQTIALIMLYATSEQAAAILSELPRDRQLDVAMRIASMDRTSPDIIKEVENILERKLSSVVSSNLTEIGGVKSIADILNRVDRSTEKYILDELEKADHFLSEQVRRRLFIFEDVVSLDSKSIQRVIKEVNPKDLVVALKGANRPVFDVIMSNMSKRQQDTIHEEMEYLGPIRLSEVEEAQQKIVQAIRKLEESNEIIVSRGGKDDMFV